MHTTSKRAIAGAAAAAVPATDGRSRLPQEYGSALEHANQPVTTCDFPVPPELSPDGTGAQPGPGMNRATVQSAKTSSSR